MEEVVKKKRGRPRKVAVPEEIEKIVETMKREEHEEFERMVEEQRQKTHEEWDVPKDQHITFFDKRLSYELTGYRPITDTQGLDFDPSWFTEARDRYIRTHHYTQYRFGTKAYRDFWTEEYRRCRDGYTVNGYTVTGPNYYYLNYYQLPNIEVEKLGSGRTAIFPRFLVFQYEFFHYFEICRTLKKDVCLMKARGVGFSEINASICACIYNCFRESKCVVTTYAKNQLEKSLKKTWGALDYCNEHSDGGFAKLTQGKKDAYTRRASIKTKDRNGIETETGWMSEIEGIVADDPSKVRGDRVDLLVFEEAGSNPVLRKSYIQGKALIYIGGSKFGIRLCGGTGGDKGVALSALKEMYRKPQSYDVLPFYHNYTPTGEWTYTSYFIPSYIGAVIEWGEDRNGVKRQLLDHRGYCLWQNYKAQLDEDRKALLDDPKALIEHCAEYCYTADEAFDLEGENKFNKIILTDQLTKIRAQKICPDIDTGGFTFSYRPRCPNRIDGCNIQDVVWHTNPAGKVHILEHPLWLQPEERDDYTNELLRGPIPKSSNLYVAGVDGIDIGASQTSAETREASDFCIIIYKRVYGLDNPKVVAYYKDRPQDLREAYHTAMALALYYNAHINIEATRMSFCNWAKSNHFLNWFMKRPRRTYTDINKVNSNQYGTPATATIIDHQTDLIRDYIEDYGSEIWFEELLEELKSYSNETKGKFDMVAAFGMALLADEDLNGTVPKAVQDNTTEVKLLGYYTDENGFTRFGAIPAIRQPQIKYNSEYYDDSREIRSSNPKVLFGGVW